MSKTCRSSLGGGDDMEFGVILVLVATVIVVIGMAYMGHLAYKLDEIEKKRRGEK